MLSKKHGPSTYRYVKHKHSTCRRQKYRKPCHQKKHRCNNYTANQIEYDKSEKAIKHKDHVDVTPDVCENEQEIKKFVEKIIAESIEKFVAKQKPEIKDTDVEIVEPIPEIDDILVKKKKTYVIRKEKKS